MGEVGFPASPFRLTANGRNWLMALRKKHAVQGGDAGRYKSRKEKRHSVKIISYAETNLVFVSACPYMGSNLLLYSYGRKYRGVS